MCRPFVSRLNFEQWKDTLAELALHSPRLVVIDTLAVFLPGAVENNASALLNALQQLHMLTAQGAAVLLMHHPRKGARGVELSPRGSGALTGFADILIDLDRPSSPDYSDRVRRLAVASRLQDSFQRLIELNAAGTEYTVLPAPLDADGFEAGWPILTMVLEDSSSKPTRDDILHSWPSDYDKPAKTTLRRWLATALEQGLIERHGKGRHHSPYKYCLRGQISYFEDLPELEPLHYDHAHMRPKEKSVKELMKDVTRGFGLK